MYLLTRTINDYELNTILEEHGEGFLEFIDYEDEECYVEDINYEGEEFSVEKINITNLDDLYKLTKKQFKEFLEQYRVYLKDTESDYNFDDLVEYIND